MPHYSPEGLCSACQAFDARKTIDWQQRERDFLELVSNNRGSSHDVIVACSGGKDSTWQVVKCLELGFRPLAVTATTDHLSEIGRRNLDNISNLCDHVEVTPHKPTRRKIAKFALEEIGDVSWCEHQLIWSVPARESIARNIPIVLYGECPQNEYGAGPQGSEVNDQLTPQWISEFGGLLGLRLADLSDILKIDPRHLEIYRYPKEHNLVKARFMGYYFPWDGFENALVAKKNGFTTWAGKKVEGSWGNYENLDNLQTGIHDYLRWLKFGYGRDVDIISNFIRRGHITREDAIEEIRVISDRNWRYPDTYLGVPLKDILAGIGLGVAEFDEICKRFTNKEVVDWALRQESYQCFYGTSMDQSKAGDSIRAVA